MKLPVQRLLSSILLDIFSVCLVSNATSALAAITETETGSSRSGSSRTGSSSTGSSSTAESQNAASTQDKNSAHTQEKNSAQKPDTVSERSRTENPKTVGQPKIWLHKMEQALDQQSFSGRFVHVMDNRIRSLQLLHTQINGDIYERLTHLDGPKIEIIRQGEKIYCYFPGRPSMRLDQPSKPSARLNTSPVSRNLSLPINAIEAHYQLSQLPEDRIAGLTAIPIRLTPRDSHRYQYAFWLEASSGLLIKSNISTPEGEPLESFEFTQVEFSTHLTLSHFEPIDSAVKTNDQQTNAVNNQPLLPSTSITSTSITSTSINASTDSINANTDSIKTKTDAISTTTNSISTKNDAIKITADSIKIQQLPDWQIDWLPEGFVQTNMRINTPQQPNHSLAMKLFTDGVASFSIFIESMPANRRLLPDTTAGATLSTSRWLVNEKGRYAATLMGELPMQSAKKVIESIQLIASNP